MNDQEYKFRDLHGVRVHHLEYLEIPPMGVGRNRQIMVNMDEFVNHDQDEELHIECCKGLALTNDYKPGGVAGISPPEDKVRMHNDKSWSDMLYHLEQYDPKGLHSEAIREIIDIKGRNNSLHHLYKYAYYALGAPIPWYFSCYLKDARFVDKSTEGTFTPNAAYFPKLLKYVETLPFKEVGRILFLGSFPNAGVLCHRDSVAAEHKDHSINLFFTAGRTSYVWDPVKKEKIYLDPNAKSYFFNNRDLHGVDPDPVFRYTLRVDGTFTDEVCEKLGLEDGYTWKWDYMKEQQ